MERIGTRRSPVTAALIGLTAAFLLISGCAAGPDVSGLTEASGDFDAIEVKRFLFRVSGLAEGFGAAEIEAVTAQMGGLSAGAENWWEYTVTHEGEPTRLLLHVSMKDAESARVAFHTSSELAAAIRREMSVYFDDLTM